MVQTQKEIEDRGSKIFVATLIGGGIGTVLLIQKVQKKWLFGLGGFAGTVVLATALALGYEEQAKKTDV